MLIIPLKSQAFLRFYLVSKEYKSAFVMSTNLWENHIPKATYWVGEP